MTKLNFYLAWWRILNQTGVERTRTFEVYFLDRYPKGVENNTNGKDFKNLDSFCGLGYQHSDNLISGCTGRVEQYYFDSVAK